MEYLDYQKLTLEEKYKLVVDQLYTITNYTASHLIFVNDKDQQEELRKEMHNSHQLLMNLDVEGAEYLI